MCWSCQLILSCASRGVCALSGCPLWPVSSDSICSTALSSTVASVVNLYTVHFYTCVQTSTSTTPLRPILSTVLPTWSSVQSQILSPGSSFCFHGPGFFERRSLVLVLLSVVLVPGVSVGLAWQQPPAGRAVGPPYTSEHYSYIVEYTGAQQVIRSSN